MSSRWGMTSRVSGGPIEPISNERYQEKAAIRQASYARKKASATQEKGLIIVHTGPGKGKTTAALGLAFRALGQGMKVGEELRRKREMLLVGDSNRDCEGTRAYY
jgi:hypothetical protein